MKSHKINENENTISVCIELNNRISVREPIETVDLGIIEMLLRNSGHDTNKLNLSSGPNSLTNYTTKNQPPPVLCGEWVFTKKVEKKVNKIEIKPTPVTSKKRRRTRKKFSSGE